MSAERWEREVTAGSETGRCKEEGATSVRTWMGCNPLGLVRVPFWITGSYTVDILIK